MANKIILIEDGKETEISENLYSETELTISIQGDNNICRIDKSIRFLKSNIYIRASNCFVEMKKTTLDWPVVINASIRNGDYQRLEIGENFTSGGTNIEMICPYSSVNIGDDCMFSQNVYIEGGDGHCIFEKGIEKDIINGFANVEIGSHVWVSRNVCFTKYSKVSSGCIVGLGAIVTRRHEEKDVALGGFPAKVIKNNIRWDRESIRNFMDKKEQVEKNNIVKFEGKDIYLEEFVNSKIKIDVKGTDNEIIIEDNVCIKGKPISIVITGCGHKVHIKKGVFVNRGLLLVINKGVPNKDNNNSEICIGENCKFNGENIQLICGEENTKIHVGNECLFASNITITTTDSHPIYDADSMERLNQAENVYLSGDVWVCQDVLILKGTSIEKGSIIAARSLVNKRFEEENILIGGSPAKVLRNNCIWKYTEDSK